MAGLLTSRGMRATLFQLPPSLRVDAYRNAFSRRSFSASAMRKDPTAISRISDQLLSVPALLFNGIHTIGIPWFAVIPISAILVRGILVHYLLSVPAQKDSVTQRYLEPLAAARGAHRTREWLQWKARERAWKKIALPPPVLAGERMVWSIYYHIKEKQVLGKMFKAPFLNYRPFLNLAVLVTFTEVIRKKCGSHDGLLPLLLWPFEKLKQGVKSLIGQATPDVSKAPEPVLSREEVFAERMLASREAQSQAQASAVGPEPQATTSDDSILSTSDTLAQPSTFAQYSSIDVDPTLKVEGLSWCTDLTVADPTFILPATFSIIMALNILAQPSGGTTVSTSTQSERKATDVEANLTAPVTDVNMAQQNLGLQSKKDWRKIFPTPTFLQRMQLSLSLLFFFVALKIPAGVILYIISSLVTGMFSSRWLKLKYPLPPAIRPCKRPVRTRVKQVIGDV